MADNATFIDGSGATRTGGTDQIAGIDYPRIKVGWGADGAINDTSAANPLPVVQTGTPALPTGAATETTLAAAAASLSVLDDWDETDRAKVNVIAGQAGITAGAGAVAANTPRTTLASDDPAVTALQIIDDWDETDRAKVNIIAGQAGVTAGAGTVAANTPRVTLASDDPAVASLSVLDDWDESDRAKINPIVGQAGVAGGSGTVGATTQRVTIATDDAVSSNLNNALVGDYETVSASQTAQVLGATGAAGDFITGILVVPASTSPGNVLLLDNATSITVFAGGASSVSNLVPFFIPLGMKSASGAWKITTGANVSCIGVGNFT